MVFVNKAASFAKAHAAALFAASFMVFGSHVAAQDEGAGRGEAKAPLSPVEFVALPGISSLSASDDGRFISYVLASVDWKDDRRDNRLVIRDCSGVSCRDVALPGVPFELEDEAIWRPDAHQFIVLREGEGDKHDQAYLIDLLQQTSTRLTDHGSSVGNVQWLPDGSGFVFEADAKPTSDDETKWAIQAFGSEDKEALYHCDLSSRETRRILASDGIIEGYSIGPDGAQIILRQRFEPQKEDRNSAELWLADFHDGEMSQLTQNRYRENAARLSPDGTQFAFIATVNEAGEPYYEDNLFVQKVGEARARLLMRDVPVEVLDLEWDASGDALWIIGNSGLRDQLYKVTLADERVEMVTRGDHSLGNWRYLPKTGTHFAQVSTATDPGEVYQIGTGKSGPRALTQAYGDLPQKHLLPEQRAFSWAARDGQEIEGLLVYPIGYQAGRSYPLVTITHGGPRSSSQFGSWNKSRYVSVLAGQGYAVLLPNHRGGTGYGDAFMRDMVGNYFRNSHLDVMDGIDALIAQGIADPDKLIKMGWSAGGHMTNHLITATNRFRVASSGAGVADWVSLYGESDRRAGRTPWFGGTPWEEGAPLDAYAAQSPLFNAWKVQTPTLFWNGGDDVRVPATQAIMMHRAVRDTGTPTHLYLGKGEPHNFRRPSNMLFKINRELAWYAEHLGREPFAADIPGAATNGDKESEAPQ